MSRARAKWAALAIALIACAPAAAQACAVCSAGRDDETRAAFIVTTALLSLLPLGLIGGFAWWIRRRLRRSEQAPARPRDLAA